MKSKEDEKVGAIGCLCLIGIFLFIKYPLFMCALLALCIVGAIIYSFLQHKEREKLEQERKLAEQRRIQAIADEHELYINCLHAIINSHINTLCLKKKQLIWKDDYGNLKYENWLNEINYFIENVVAPALNFPITNITDAKHNEMVDIILHIVDEYEKKNPHLFADSDVNDMDGIEFEHYCAEILSNAGWNARVTSASGDQGIDIIATCKNVKVVFQCKKYSQDVGNSAVQQIYAGKEFEKAHFAAVITNSAFTKSAKQLAKSTGVYLLHHTDLPQFAKQLGFDNTQSHSSIITNQAPSSSSTFYQIKSDDNSNSQEFISNLDHIIDH